jgi:hypothetical protein
MTRRILIAYQLLTGISDTSTGALLIVAPALTLRLMSLDAPANALVYVSFIGAFVFSVGLACLYGARLAYRASCLPKLEVVWLLTVLARASVASFVFAQVVNGALQPGWLSVAVTDGTCVVIQTIGLRRGWLAHVSR